MTYFTSGQWNALCRVCNLELPLSEFYLGSNKKPMRRCKKCHLAYGAEWAAKNKEKRRASAARSYAKNPEKALAATRNWRKANLSYDAFRAKTYRETKAARVPSWADLEKIKDIYKTCPEGYHVDHIIPLRGKLVSGLHVENNLQHLPAKENMKKRNFYNES
jgi:hypothetical protein